MARAMCRRVIHRVVTSLSTFAASFLLLNCHQGVGAAQPLNTVFQLHMDATEVGGTTNGSIITPSAGPAGYTGNVVNNGGSMNYVPAQVGNGAYFLNCCQNSGNAYYKFTGPQIGNIFNVNQGQVSFYLKSRYSFSNRAALAPQPRYAFDVQDGNPGNHLFFFKTEVATSQGQPYLLFTWRVGNGAVAGYTSYFYWVSQTAADALFGSGVTLSV